MIHAFTHLLIHSHILVHEYLFLAISVLGTLLGTGETAVKKKWSLTSTHLRLVGDSDAVFAAEPTEGTLNQGLGNQKGTLGGGHLGKEKKGRRQREQHTEDLAWG